ncbi:hypothetical protein NECAME_17338 [Necator americanus]|uniref:CNNM transmembrane domain-containing protein n=1 Tax=Necator americanus TaxID=51031 RepID=W2TQ69_NECAM|nr:hypothetical protein NECAME_17338 [Necator americanus]ETN83799.1 hypothetical protein NECAME_17338 [Necator americanus]
MRMSINDMALIMDNGDEPHKHKYGSVLKYIVPTIMIVLLAEILPQSVCNRSGLKLAAKTRHITLILFVVCAPVAWPLSKIIDWVLGRESKKMEVAAQGGESRVTHEKLVALSTLLQIS